MLDLPVISTLALSPMVTSLMVVGFVAVSVVLILVILIQRPQGGGLSGAFGAGAGSGQTAFGAKTGDALTIATVFMFVMFLVVAIGLGFMTRPEAMAPTAPVITTTPLSGDELPVEGEPVDDGAGDEAADDGTDGEPEDLTLEASEAPADDTPADPTPTDEPAEEPASPDGGG